MKCCIYTLGCKVNQYESEAIGLALTKRGIDVEFGLGVGDIYILNTCAVTNEAEHKSREVIAKINKLNSDAKIYVCGCSSELHADTFLERENVQAVIGTEAKEKLIEIIENESLGNLTQPICNNQYNDNYNIEGERIRSYLKIQDGCNNFCSYCIIPYTRGRERSRDPESIEREYKQLTMSSKEIVLVGINLSHYGSDRSDQENLATVIKRLAKLGDARIRISSLECDAISEELMEVLKNTKSFCPSFHIPLQNGSDNVLKKMNRHYDFKQYKKAIDLIRANFDNASISTDLIVGFPTESEEDFDECLKNVESIGFSSMHIFPFSKRAGTVADKLPQINGNIIKDRIKRLKSVADKSRENFLKSQIGKVCEVLVEESIEGEYIGYTENYLKCFIRSNEDLTNKIVNVKITELYNSGVKGEIVDERN